MARGVCVWGGGGLITFIYQQQHGADRGPEPAGISGAVRAMVLNLRLVNTITL